MLTVLLVWEKGSAYIADAWVYTKDVLIKIKNPTNVYLELFKLLENEHFQEMQFSSERLKAGILLNLCN